MRTIDVDRDNLNSDWIKQAEIDRIKNNMHPLCCDCVDCVQAKLRRMKDIGL